MPSNPIPDGVYFLHPDGSGWIGAEIRNGQCVGRIEQSNAATHLAARDHYAGLVPSDSDTVVELNIAEAIVRCVMGSDIDPYYIAVTQKVNP